MISKNQDLYKIEKLNLNQYLYIKKIAYLVLKLLYVLQEINIY